MMKRIILIILTIAAFLGFTAWLQGEEIKPPAELVNMNFTISYDDLADVPHDFAKDFPAPMYYFWALAHNAKVSGQPLPATPPVIQQKVNGFSPGFSWYGSSARPGQYNQQTITRVFSERVGSGPVTIYNPYFRLDPK